MLRHKIWLPAMALVVVVAGIVISAGTGFAANNGGNGLRISPVRSDLTVNAGSSQTVPVNVTNVTAQSANLQTIINDFVGNPDESGSPAIILDPNKYAPTHSLKRYVVPGGTFTLAPGQSKAVPITINIPKDAPAGGYFGAVRFAPAGTNSNPNQTVSLAGSVGSLILIKVPGDITEKISIASFDVRSHDRPSSFFTTNKNLTATVRFQNQGNLQEAPFGKVLLKNRSGKLLGSFEVNNVTPAGNVLPDSIRKFPVNLKGIGRFGQYKLEGNFGYGTNGQLLSASTTFYIIPLSVIIIFVAVVLLLAFLVFVLPRLIRRYNQAIVRRAGRTLSRNRK